MEDKVILKDLKIDVQKLLQLGFVKESNYYKYETKIMNNQFSLIIKIDMNNVISSDVIELSTGEKFMLYYVTSATGEFVGKIREEYNKIIEKLLQLGFVKESNYYKYETKILKKLKIIVALKIYLKVNMLT